MKKLIVIICLFALLLSGCGEVEASGNYTEVGTITETTEETVKKESDPSSRLNVVDYQLDWLVDYYIIVDEATGVMYLYTQDGESAGLTVMVDPSGDPLIWRD